MNLTFEHEIYAFQMFPLFSTLNTVFQEIRMKFISDKAKIILLTNINLFV